MTGSVAGPRWVDVPPERLVRWVDAFAVRHGPAVAEPCPGVVVLRASDGAAAACHPPFPPLPTAAPWEPVMTLYGMSSTLMGALPSAALSSAGVWLITGYVP